jgi:hypothetical protein
MFYRVPSTDGKTTSALDVNLVYSKFLFVTLKAHARARTRLRDAGSCIARGFFNDFHANGSPNPPSNETVQFLEATTPRQCNDGPGVALRHRRPRMARPAGSPLVAVLGLPPHNLAGGLDPRWQAGQGSSCGSRRAMSSRVCLNLTSWSAAVPDEPAGSGSAQCSRVALAPRMAGQTSSAHSVTMVSTVAGSMLSTCLDRWVEISIPSSAIAATASG